MMSTKTLRTYTELMEKAKFEERFEYLKLSGKVGAATFGSDRIFNQMFYTSAEWKSVRNYVIVRDNGCDLGTRGHEIGKEQKIFIHHMNPIMIDDIANRSDILLDPEYLITVTFQTHNAIHYGDKSLLIPELVVRTKNDTCPWKRRG